MWDYCPEWLLVFWQLLITEQQCMNSLISALEYGNWNCELNISKALIATNFKMPVFMSTDLKGKGIVYGHFKSSKIPLWKTG